MFAGAGLAKKLEEAVGILEPGDRSDGASGIAGRERACGGKGGLVF